MRAPGEGHQYLGLCAENTKKMQGCEGVSVVCIFAFLKKKSVLVHLIFDTYNYFDGFLILTS